MAELHFTLIGDGSGDLALLSIIRWLLRQHLPGVEIVGTWPEAGHRTAGRSLAERVVECVKAEQAHLLLIHCDGDAAGRAPRLIEIEQAVTLAARQLPTLPFVLPVVPVRMLETWLLTDEHAIRLAVGNPNGDTPLSLPRARDLESIVNPKAMLRALCSMASGLGTHRRRTLVVGPIRVAELTESFGALRQLPAFQAFEEDVRRVIAEQGWPERLG
jgi:hypothetical protein